MFIVSRTKRAPRLVGSAWRLLLVLIAMHAGALAAAAQRPASEEPFFTARYDPSLHFQTITTPRFSIYFHQREEAIAARLARLVEEVARELEPQLGLPRGRVHVVLVDQTDQSNGWATSIPYNLMELSAAPPEPQSVIGNTDDWLRLVFTHEYTHVLHLEKSGGWLGSLRHVFGRLPLFYPNVFLPVWQIEGIATYVESAVTGHGRVPAGDFRMILDQASASGRFASLDRAAGGVVDWPSGNIPYLYGAYFHQYLAEKYGAPSVGRLADETARRLPFFGSRAFKSVYGRSLGDLWDDFVAESAQRRSKAAPDSRTRLTRHGFVVTSPVFAAGGRIFYAVANPHGFPALMELSSGRHEPREIASRVGGNRIAATGDTLVFDQLEVLAEVAVQSDIYARDLRGGDTRRLTRRARAADPDVSPDGQTIVCTVQHTDRRSLATFALPAAGALAEPQVLISSANTNYSAPRWSPDGRAIVAERRRVGGPSEIVVIDVASRVARALVASSAARNVLPSWMPDGRSILFSSDREGRPFTLYSADATTGRLRRLAGAGAGAQAPAVAPDGRQLVFVGYSAEGYDLYSIPFDAPTWEDVSVESAAGPATAAPTSSDVPAARPYSPWRTLRPTFWTPVIEPDTDDVRVGAATAGVDALGRHGYAAYAAWAVDRARAEWQLDYTYARYRPALFASVSQDTDAWRTGEVRSTGLTAGVLFPTRRVRWSMTSLASLHTSREHFLCDSCETPVDRRHTRNAVRGGWSFSNAKSFGYSISAEQGAFLQAATELTRRGLGSDANAAAWIGDARAYVRVWPRHGVVAGRFAAAAATGDREGRRVFTAGGSGPQGGGFDFGTGAIGLLRGFEASDLFGDRAMVANLDYRFPLAWIQRGFGTLPFLLRNVHGALFVDVGHAWDGTQRASELRRSIGAELSFDVVLGYSLPVTIATGAAWRHGHGRDPDGAGFFVRLGRAF